MFERLKKWLRGPIVYKVIEVNPELTHKRWDEETKVAVAGLDEHPGWEAIRALRAWQISILKSKLISEHQDDLRKVDFLQNGIYWLSWDDQQIAKAQAHQSGSIASRQRNPNWEELEEIKMVENSVERFTPEL